MTNPDVIIEELSNPKDGRVPERNSSYVFVKAFTNADGTRDYMFTSVSNLRDGIEIVMSNQEEETPRIKRLLKEGKLAYINKATLPSEFTASAQGDQSTIPSEVSYSESKDTTSSPNMQEERVKFSLRELDVSYLDAVDKNGNRYYDHNLTAVAKGKLIDIANNEQSAVTSGFGTTPDTESTTNSQRKYRELISILQTNSSKFVDANGEPKIEPGFSLRNAETEKIFATAKEKFGITYDMREAGWILPDGSTSDIFSEQC